MHAIPIELIHFIPTNGRDRNQAGTSRTSVEYHLHLIKKIPSHVCIESMYRDTLPQRSKSWFTPQEILIIRLYPFGTNYKSDLIPQESLKYGNSPPESLLIFVIPPRID